MEIHSDLDGYSSIYVFNFTCALLTSIILLRLFFRHPHVFVKPSMLIIGCYHVLAQWPLVVLSGFTERYLSDPWAASFLINGLIFFGLLLGTTTWERHARAIWARIPADTSTLSGAAGTRAVAVLVVLALALAVIYLSHVPFSQTGLYALLTDPSTAVEAREESLKLVESALPRYALSLLSSALAPVLTAFGVLLISEPRRTIASKLLLTSALFGVWALSFLSGAKGILVFLIFVVFATLGWRRRLRLSLTWLAAAAAAVLLPAFIVTMVFASQSRDEDAPMAFDDAAIQAGETAKRAFVIPTLVGLWYIDYAQQSGPVGLAGIPRLAAVVGSNPISLPSRIALEYGPEYYGHPVAVTMSAPAGFPFALYGYFGMWSLVLSLMGLVVCDAILAFVWRLPDIWIIPALAMISLCALRFAQSDYLTVWVSHGLAPGLLLIACLSQMGSTLPANSGIASSKVGAQSKS